MSNSWCFGDCKYYTSLSLISNVLGIPILKDDINGSQVTQVYYKEKNINRIVIYCEKDMITIPQIVLHSRNVSLLETDEKIHS